MKILADRQIPCVRQACAGLGELILCDGRAINAHEARDADALLVRSVTPVNADLLSGSKVRFVASATSGIDHVDTTYLRNTGIAFAHAPGSNAQAVVEYVLSCLCVLSSQAPFRLQDKVAGIIGCGEVGSRLQRALETIGVQCLVNDPPLAAAGEVGPFCDLEDIVEADIITLHAPLTDTGAWPTRNLIDAEVLARLKPDAILINTSRGGVIDEVALKAALRERRMAAVLDVWVNEPDLDRELLAQTAIGTPHIAGYSADARVRATAMIHNALCGHLRVTGSWRPETELADLPHEEINISAGTGIQDGLELAILSHYDVRSDAAALFPIRSLERQKCGRFFDELRRKYPVRREFSSTILRLPATDPLAKILEDLGFRVTSMAAGVTP